jgi:hypothetical protein
MQTLATFLIIILVIYIYLIYYHKIDTSNILDVMHTAFIRQLVFELIPFIILFGTREMHFINVSNATQFFNSVIGRSMIGMIAFTFVSYVIVAATPHKPSPISIHTEQHQEIDEDDEHDKEESQYISNNNGIEKFGNARIYKRKKPTANDTQLLQYALI